MHICSLVAYVYESKLRVSSHAKVMSPCMAIESQCIVEDLGVSDFSWVINPREASLRLFE